MVVRSARGLGKDGGMSPTPVGLVGIGLVGTALAQRLLSAGLQVRGCDVLAQRREALQGLGGEAVESLRGLQGCSTILLSLPDATIASQVVESLVTQREGALPSGH